MKCNTVSKGARLVTDSGKDCVDSAMLQIIFLKITRIFLEKSQIEFKSKRAKDRFNLSILDDSWHQLKLLTKGIRNVVFFFD